MTARARKKEALEQNERSLYDHFNTVIIFSIRLLRKFIRSHFTLLEHSKCYLKRSIRFEIEYPVVFQSARLFPSN